jgi:DnaJ-class molecular chaperone
MTYTRDQQNVYCSRCRKKVRMVKCPKCNGKGRTATTQCPNCNNTGYKCENGVNDRYH